MQSINIEHKLAVLCRLAEEFNHQNLLWAVGASLMLYFKGYVDDFSDLDLMVADKDALKMEQILENAGTKLPTEKGSFETKHFRKFIVDFVEIDMIGGFAIVKNGKVYDCDLEEVQITDWTEVNGQKIPLQSVDVWRNYYDLMGRTKKVAIIDGGSKWKQENY